MANDNSIYGSDYYDVYLQIFDEWILQKSYLDGTDDRPEDRMIKVVFSENGEMVERAITLENFEKFEPHLVNKGIQYTIYEGGAEVRPSKRHTVRHHFEQVLTVIVDFNDGNIKAIEMTENQFRRMKRQWINENYGFTAVDMVGNIVDRRCIQTMDSLNENTGT